MNDQRKTSQTFSKAGRKITPPSKNKSSSTIWENKLELNHENKQNFVTFCKNWENRTKRSTSTRKDGAKRSCCPKSGQYVRAEVAEESKTYSGAALFGIFNSDLQKYRNAKKKIQFQRYPQT